MEFLWLRYSRFPRLAQGNSLPSQNFYITKRTNEEERNIQVMPQFITLPIFRCKIIHAVNVVTRAHNRL